MIPRDYVTAWRGNAPWVEDAQVEQDLVISRALVEMFSQEDEESVTGSFSKKTPSKKTGNSDRWNHYIFRSVMAPIAIPLTSPEMSSKSLFGETRG